MAALYLVSRRATLDVASLEVSSGAGGTWRRVPLSSGWQGHVSGFDFQYLAPHVMVAERQTDSVARGAPHGLERDHGERRRGFPGRPAPDRAVLPASRADRTGGGVARARK